MPRQMWMPSYTGGCRKPTSKVKSSQHCPFYAVTKEINKTLPLYQREMCAGIQYMFTHQAEQFQMSPNGDEEQVVAERQSVLFAPKIRSLAAALSTPEAVVTLLDAKASTDLPSGFYASNQDRWFVKFHCNHESRWCRCGQEAIYSSK